jgi:hypothetical protein
MCGVADLLDQFLAHELNDYVRSTLLDAAVVPIAGSKYFTFNAFNVLLDFERAIAVVENELDPTASETVDLSEFTRRLGS